jgi:hypothetical protein
MVGGTRKWLSNVNAAIAPHPSPTKMPDGTVLVGVLYDCARQDLLFYSDALLVGMGSNLDTYASAQPYGVDVARGSSIADLPALGPVIRPEARRLTEMLRRQSRTEFLKLQTAEYDELPAKKAKNYSRPTLTPWRYFDCVLIHRPRTLGAARIFLRTTTNAYLDLSMENNDWGYTKELLEACIPGVWREVDKREYQAVLRSS